MRYLVKFNPGYDSKNETEKGGNNKAHNIEAGETHLFAQKIPVRTVLDQILLEAIKKGCHVLKSLVNVCLLLGIGFHPDLHHHHIEDVVTGTMEAGIKQRILLKVFAGKAEETAQVASQGRDLGDDKLFTVRLDVGEDGENAEGGVLLAGGPIDWGYTLVVGLSFLQQRKKTLGLFFFTVSNYSHSQLK